MPNPAITIEGTVTGISDLFEKGSFRKRELYVRTDDKYPIDVAIEFTNENESKLDFVETGEKVKVNCNLRGRKWVNDMGVEKYFLSLQSWKMEKL